MIITVVIQKTHIYPLTYNQYYHYFCVCVKHVNKSFYTYSPYIYFCKTYITHFIFAFFPDENNKNRKHT